MSKPKKTRPAWIEVSSRSQPGRVYYYNKITHKSSWSQPLELEFEREKSCKPQVVRSENTSDSEPAKKVQSDDGGERAKKSKPPNLKLQRNNNGNMESVQPLSEKRSGVTGSHQLPPTPATNDYGGGIADGEVEDMDCEERWGDAGEVAMDCDLSEAQQEQLITEIAHTRGALLPVTSLEDFDLSTAPQVQYKEKLYFVLDTNVLISHLEFLVELKDYSIKGVGRPVLVVPWVVMQELDALKSRSNTQLVDKARKAIDMLHKSFSAGHPRVIGQTMEEVQTEKDNTAISNNDDRILHCCLLYQEKVKGHDGLVVLFSNDIQLCSKALLNGVRALNRKTLLSELRILCKSMSNAPPTSYTHTSEYASRVASAQKQAVVSQLVDDLICQSEAIVREGLSTIIKKEMIEAYDENLWIQVVIEKPPWTLKDLAHILDKHWIAVFGLVLDRTMKDTITGLCRYVTTRSMNIGGALELETFHRLAFQLLKAFQLRSDYGGVIPHCLSQLSVLSQKGLEAKIGMLPQPHPPTPSGPAPLSPFQPHPPLSISPTKLPPTPPATPSQSFPPFGGIPPQLEHLIKNIPPSPMDQLPWLLQFAVESIQYFHSHLLNNLQRDKVHVANQLANVIVVLDGLVVSMNRLINSQLDMDILREVIQAFENFVINVLALITGDKDMKFVCPLTLQHFHELLHGSEAHREMFKSGFLQLQHYLRVLNLLRQSL